jgi:hypothetical protein
MIVLLASKASCMLEAFFLLVGMAVAASSVQPHGKLARREPPLAATALAEIGPGAHWAHPSYLGDGDSEAPRSATPQALAAAFAGKTGKEADVWNFRLEGDEEYCLAVESPIEDSSEVHIYECNNEDSQKWVVEGEHIKLANHTDLCLHLEGVQVSNGASINVVTCSGHHHENWTISGKDIKLSHHPSFCVTVEGTVQNEGVVELAECNGHMGQWHQQLASEVDGTFLRQQEFASVVQGNQWHKRVEQHRRRRLEHLKEEIAH